ncbi:hypothetical protein B0H10DRAFT_2132254 [Mycena sp. CBHHK59/15]|nr:hypothetical protein B0H10DRAFT_2132254 [Mycena sp. CBHHK59/15]
MLLYSGLLCFKTEQQIPMICAVAVASSLLGDRNIGSVVRIWGVSVKQKDGNRSRESR